MRIDVVLPGEPSAWKRARVRVFGKFAQHYDDPAQRAKKETIATLMLAARANAGRTEPFTGALAVTVFAVRSLPKSEHRKKSPVLLRRYDTKKPDLDNVAKLIGDSGNGILWIDDAQIARFFIDKLVGAQGETPFTTISVREMDTQAEVGGEAAAKAFPG